MRRGVPVLKNWKVRLTAMIVCGSSFAVAHAQSELPAGAALQALLTRMKANLARNAIPAQEYTFTESWHNQNWDKKGKKADDETATYENVFVEADAEGIFAALRF